MKAGSRFPSVSIAVPQLLSPSEELGRNPRALPKAFNLFPQYYVLSLSRLALIKGVSTLEMWPEYLKLLAVAVLFFGLGIKVFSWGLAKAKKEGTLGHF